MWNNVKRKPENVDGFKDDNKDQDDNENNDNHKDHKHHQSQDQEQSRATKLASTDNRIFTSTSYASSSNDQDDRDDVDDEQGDDDRSSASECSCCCPNEAATTSPAHHGHQGVADAASRAPAESPKRLQRQRELYEDQVVSDGRASASFATKSSAMVTAMTTSSRVTASSSVLMQTTLESSSSSHHQQQQQNEHHHHEHHQHLHRHEQSVHNSATTTHSASAERSSALAESASSHLDQQEPACDVSEQEREQALLKRSYVLAELVETERDYVADLRKIVENYLDEIRRQLVDCGVADVLTTGLVNPLGSLGQSGQTDAQNNPSGEPVAGEGVPGGLGAELGPQSGDSSPVVAGSDEPRPLGQDYNAASQQQGAQNSDTGAKAKGPSLPESLRDGKHKIIFGNIEAIYEFHRDHFLVELERCLHESARLGPLFKRYERRLNMYVVYCQNKPRSELIVSEHLDSYFEELRIKFGHKLQLPDLLIKPVQRITKYQLLLKDILRYTERANLPRERADLLKAVEIMLVVPKAADDMMNVGRLNGFSGKLTAQGKLIKQGVLQFCDITPVLNQLEASVVGEILAQFDRHKDPSNSSASTNDNSNNLRVLTTAMIGSSQMSDRARIVLKHLLSGALPSTAAELAAPSGVSSTTSAGLLDDSTGTQQAPSLLGTLKMRERQTFLFEQSIIFSQVNRKAQQQSSSSRYYGSLSVAASGAASSGCHPPFAHSHNAQGRPEGCCYVSVSPDASTCPQGGPISSRVCDQAHGSSFYHSLVESTQTTTGANNNEMKNCDHPNPNPNPNTNQPEEECLRLVEMQSNSHHHHPLSSSQMAMFIPNYYSMPTYEYKNHLSINKIALIDKHYGPNQMLPQLYQLFGNSFDLPVESCRFMLKSRDPNQDNVIYLLQSGCPYERDDWVCSIKSMLECQLDFLRALQSPIAYQRGLTKEGSTSEFASLWNPELRKTMSNPNNSGSQKFHRRIGAGVASGLGLSGQAERAGSVRVAPQVTSAAASSIASSSSSSFSSGLVGNAKYLRYVRSKLSKSRLLSLTSSSSSFAQSQIQTSQTPADLHLDGVSRLQIGDADLEQQPKSACIPPQPPGPSQSAPKKGNFFQGFRYTLKPRRGSKQPSVSQTQQVELEQRHHHHHRHASSQDVVDVLQQSHSLGAITSPLSATSDLQASAMINDKNKNPLVTGSGGSSKKHRHKLLHSLNTSQSSAHSGASTATDTPSSSSGSPSGSFFASASQSSTMVAQSSSSFVAMASEHTKVYSAASQVSTSRSQVVSSSSSSSTRLSSAKSRRELQ